MDARTREALEKSIAHWQDNLAAETPGPASTKAEDCALCQEFMTKGDDPDASDCRGCPVAEKTLARYCIGTPYPRAARSLGAWKKSPTSETQRDLFREAAQAELDFLISLRPAEEADASGLKAMFDAVPPVGPID